MDLIHVVIVHFPIALLTLYAILEMLHFRRLLDLPYWFYLKASAVIFGFAGAVLAFWSGGLAEEQFRTAAQMHKLIETHENSAALTTMFFGIIALAYFTAWLGRAGKLQRFSFGGKLWNRTEAYLKSKTMVLLGIIGLMLITVTGALGGAIAFGPNVDPLAQFVYNLLIK